MYVDGNLKFTSAEMGTNTAKGFTGDIDITGATELKLVMEKGTNNWSDHGDWANAKLTKPFTAAVGDKEFTEKWSANNGEWI